MQDGNAQRTLPPMNPILRPCKPYRPMIYIPHFSVSNPIPALNPAVWWDFTDATTLYDATTGGSLVASGGLIARVEDKSGNSRHATQTNSTFRPIRTVGAIAGLDAAAFDGTNDRLLHSYNQSTPCTLFLVGKRSSGGDATYQIGISLTSNNQPFGANLSLKAGGSANWGEYINSWKATSYSTLNTWRILSLTQSGLSDTATTNGIAETFSDSSRYVGDNNDRRAIGGDPAFGSGFLSGQIAEIIVFPTALSAPNRVAVENYLNDKFAIY